MVKYFFKRAIERLLSDSITRRPNQAVPTGPSLTKTGFQRCDHIAGQLDSRRAGTGNSGIRYAIVDLAVAAPPGNHACGCVHPRLAHVEGRVSETLLDAAGNRINGLIFNGVIDPIWPIPSAVCGLCSKTIGHPESFPPKTLTLASRKPYPTLGKSVSQVWR